MGCDTYDLDALGETLLAAYAGEQRACLSEHSFPPLHLFSMALLELGILVEEDSEQKRLGSLQNKMS